MRVTDDDYIRRLLHTLRSTYQCVAKFGKESALEIWKSSADRTNNNWCCIDSRWPSTGECENNAWSRCWRRMKSSSFGNTEKSLKMSNKWEEKFITFYNNIVEKFSKLFLEMPKYLPTIYIMLTFEKGKLNKLELWIELVNPYYDSFNFE